MIDQNDRAVSDENIRYTLGAPFGMEGSRYCFSKTDSNGLFLIEGKKAHSLNFYTLKKEGYVCRDVLGFYGYDHTRASKKWTDTSPSKPFVFNLWKIGGGTQDLCLAVPPLTLLIRRVLSIHYLVCLSHDCIYWGMAIRSKRQLSEYSI